MTLSSIQDWILGPVVRKVEDKSSMKSLYLTFDDGPNPLTTPKVLEILKTNDALATFFVVGEKAEREPLLLKTILSAGHEIGNHSSDHGYRPFFASLLTIQSWVEDSENRLEKLTGRKSVGFRAPAGVRTPKLRTALKNLGIPHILWSSRFYDAIHPWKTEKALASLKMARAGDIILLHDSQSLENLDLFLTSLNLYITEAKNLGFEFKTLRRELVSSFR